ncbi:hypothetical protein [Enterovirga sp.]|uniref:hypothetical protein n=1 Tax=Enterovirga sp. TaxID=2026350 RepID=UPI002B54E210|nr:hypothetical protein [Enterovirga sp.]HMO30119.1 hypothetical protein [Enterovirga sp.]
MTPGPDRPPRDFLQEWREGDGAARAMAVFKRLAPAILFVVFMYFFTAFAGR